MLEADNYNEYDQKPASEPDPATNQNRETGVDKHYPRSRPGIMKIVEMVLVTVTFICAAVGGYWSGSGWLQYVCISALITTLLFFLYHLLRLYNSLNCPWIVIEFIHYVVYCVLLFILSIVALSQINKYYDNGSIIASALFAIASLVVYTIDTVVKFINWRASKYASGIRPVSEGGSRTTHWVLCI